MSQKFQLKAPFKPAGDQPKAIKQLVAGIKKNYHRQTLLGVTGSGKTYSMAAVINQTQKPALVISHNKTLAAQLAAEFKDFFPENAVEYFVSYYDYYQPEAYLPRTDTYIAKDSAINDEIDRLRHAAMEAILTRQDVIVVASVSCIYGLGNPTDYLDSRLAVKVGEITNRKEVLRHLARLQYTRNDTDLIRGTFRVRGDVIDIRPSGEDQILRIEFFGPKIERLLYIDDLTGEVLRATDATAIFPATFFMASPKQTKQATTNIRAEMAEQVKYFQKLGKELEAQRIAERTNYDLEMLEQIGYVSGVENYSRHLDGRAPGEPPSTLIDYFRQSYQNNFLTFIDESHMSVPQIGGMHAGDKARKTTLIRYGFRLPSAADNRPLKFNEFEDRIGQTIFVSATPAAYEANTSQQTVEQLVRPTGLLDPDITVKPTKHQIDDVIDVIQQRLKKQQRVLVTTLTKRMSEEMATYLIEIGIKAAYLHSEIDTLERLEILRDLRLGKYDVLVGINLLREGLDLPEVSLVAIMDADKEGYLRSATALIQTMGRAARHLDGHVIMYADKITGSMQTAIKETKRRRRIQRAYNKTHRITPRSIKKKISDRLAAIGPATLPKLPDEIPPEEKNRVIKELTQKMDLAARNLDFEQAAELRDAISKIRRMK
ncbi:MAG: excinuclease ABC subunit UvrB [Candidatus Andersenbacteria bacterium]|nr:excinuclease ABC subunit UvrB [Candidatus Andersenbacteria bacterium]